MKPLSTISTCVTFAGALLLGISLLLTENFPAAEEFLQLPLWLKLLMICGICLAVLGLVLSLLFKNRDNSSKVLLYLEGGVFLLGVFCALSALLREESAVRTALISASPILLSVGALCFLSSLLGCCRQSSAFRTHRRIRFFAQENESEAMLFYHGIEVKCAIDGDEIRSLLSDRRGNCTLYAGIDSIALDFDLETRRICGISLGKLRRPKRREIEPPNAVCDVILYIEGGKTFLRGHSYPFEMPQGLFFDEKNRILQLGQCDPSKPYLRFLKNAYAQLDGSGALCGILLTDL